MGRVVVVGLAAVSALMLALADRPETLLLGAGVGGVAAWTWGAVSWMALPWHHATFRRFEDEDALVRAIEATAPATGVYGYPAPPRAAKGASREAVAAAEDRVREQMRRGPLVLAVVQRSGFPAVWKPMLGAFAASAFVSLLLTWLLLRTTGLGFLERAAFVGVAGLAGAGLCRLPDWVWHGFSAPYTAVLLADAAIGWFLVGLALAWAT
jgi:hypothetical protein